MVHLKFALNVSVFENEVYEQHSDTLPNSIRRMSPVRSLHKTSIFIFLHEVNNSGAVNQTYI